MYFLRVIGIFAVIPTGLLLATSFFVFLATESIHTPGLKLFGYFVAGLLCLTAVLVLFTGLFILFTGKNPLRPLLQAMIRMKSSARKRNEPLRSSS